MEGADTSQNQWEDPLSNDEEWVVNYGGVCSDGGGGGVMTLPQGWPEAASQPLI